jgi:hypothetical protein
MATATLSVHNNGSRTVDDVQVIDEVGRAAHLRGASTDAGSCTIQGRRAICQLGPLAPASTTTIAIRVLVDRDPAGNILSNQVTLSSGDHATAVQQSLTAPMTRRPTQQAALLQLSTATVTLIAFVSFVFAHDTPD